MGYHIAIVSLQGHLYLLGSPSPLPHRKRFCSYTSTTFSSFHHRLCPCHQQSPLPPSIGCLHSLHSLTGDPAAPAAAEPLPTATGRSVQLTLLLPFSCSCNLPPPLVYFGYFSIHVWWLGKRWGYLELGGVMGLVVATERDGDGFGSVASLHMLIASCLHPQRF